MTSWRDIQKTNLRKKDDLVTFLELDSIKAAHVLQRPSFPLNLPLRLAKKMAKNDLFDPLFLQFVPLEQELDSPSNFTLEPTECSSFQLTDRLLKKYASRVLFMPTSACAMHCRFCFRRNYPYSTSPFDFTEEIAKIAHDPSILEVILSGGDPLSLSDDVLGDIIEKLDAIAHVQIIRFHSRFLIGIPERVTPDFLKIFKKIHKQIVFVFHINHPKEIDDDVANAAKKLQKAKFVLLNQSVLLKGVNDSFETLKDLSLKLIETGIIPYYLHELDRVEGASHFEVTPSKGLSLMKELKETLPGYSVPKFVKEIPRERSKTELNAILFEDI